MLIIRFYKAVLINYIYKSSHEFPWAHCVLFALLLITRFMKVIFIRGWDADYVPLAKTALPKIIYVILRLHVSLNLHLNIRIFHKLGRLFCGWASFVPSKQNLENVEKHISLYKWKIQYFTVMTDMIKCNPKSNNFVIFGQKFDYQLVPLRKLSLIIL